MQGAHGKRGRRVKDKQPFIVLSAALGIVILVGVFCYTQLEIVPSTRWESPSREVQANRFYALEKWLEAEGRPARHLSTGNLETIINATEKIIFVENSRFSWSYYPAALLPWIRNGGTLIISLDSYINFQLEELMKSLGVHASSFYDYGDIEDSGEETSTEETDNSAAEQDGEAANQTDEAEATPAFDWSMSFKITAAENPADRTLVMSEDKEIKLVKLELGKGALIFTGEAFFLSNYSLSEKANMDLAAELFFPKDKNGVLFIRGLSGDRNVLGNLAERGNPAALIISLVLLIIVGFWMVIPVFGRYKASPEKPGKPLRERFLAEGRFLKKNHALGKYIETYKKELEQKSRSKGIVSGAPEDSAAVLDSDSQIKPITFAQFIKEQKTLSEQLEKLNREKV